MNDWPMRVVKSSHREQPPTRPHSSGPVIDARAKKRIHEYLESDDVRAVCGRSVVGGSGICCRPGGDREIRAHHRLAQEEIFGPVLAVCGSHRLSWRYRSRTVPTMR